MAKSFELGKVDGKDTSEKVLQPFVLGTDENSWCWNIKSQQLHHAGIFIGKYPSFHTGKNRTGKKLYLLVCFVSQPVIGLTGNKKDTHYFGKKGLAKPVSLIF